MCFASHAEVTDDSGNRITVAAGKPGDMAYVTRLRAGGEDYAATALDARPAVWGLTKGGCLCCLRTGAIVAGIMKVPGERMRPGIGENPPAAPTALFFGRFVEDHGADHLVLYHRFSHALTMGRSVGNIILPQLEGTALIVVAVDGSAGEYAGDMLERLRPNSSFEDLFAATRPVHTTMNLAA